MEQDKLVESIVAEVLKRLLSRDQACAKPLVRVYAWRSLELAARIHPLLQAWHGPDVALVFNGEKQEGEVIARLLPLLSCTDMADLAAGQAHSETARDVLQELLQGHRVDVLDYEYLSHADTAPSALYALYRACEDKLTSYGLVRFKVKQPETRHCQEDLITAAHLEQAAEAGVRTLIVATSARITPLAAESADRLGIKLVRENESL